MIVMDPYTREYYNNVKSVVTKLGLRKEFAKAIRRMRNNCYFGTSCYMKLYKDFAPLSFTFAIMEKQTYRQLLFGGLIYQGPTCPADGSFPSLTVSFDPMRVGWFIHT